MDEYAKIAKLLEEGRISPEEAEKLLAALDEPGEGPQPPVANSLLRVRIDRADLLVRVARR
ncbi:SHOCT-like domain-containing protein [Oceanithermus sp.]